MRTSTLTTGGRLAHQRKTSQTSETSELETPAREARRSDPLITVQPCRLRAEDLAPSCKIYIDRKIVSTDGQYAAGKTRFYEELEATLQSGVVSLFFLFFFVRANVLERTKRRACL